VRPAGFALLALLALAPGCVARGPGPAPGDPARVGAEVRSALYRQRDAWNRGDLDGFLAGYWRSDSLTFYSGGEIERGWEAARERYRSRYPDREAMGKLTFDLNDVAPLGEDVALVRGAWSLERRGDAPHGLFTLVLRRLPDGTWRVVHDHTSAAP